MGAESLKATRAALAMLVYSSADGKAKLGHVLGRLWKVLLYFGWARLVDLEGSPPGSAKTVNRRPVSSSTRTGSTAIPFGSSSAHLSSDFGGRLL